MKIFAGSWLKSAEKPNNVTIECENHGCNTSCQHYEGTKSISQTNYSPLCNQEYLYTEISHNCAKKDLVTERREEIYNRADKLAEEIPYTFGGSLKAACNKKRKVFNETIDEYINGNCPFYS